MEHATDEALACRIAELVIVKLDGVIAIAPPVPARLKVPEAEHAPDSNAR
jgi:hypothetical protein